MPTHHITAEQEAVALLYQPFNGLVARILKDKFVTARKAAYLCLTCHQTIQIGERHRAMFVRHLNRTSDTLRVCESCSIICAMIQRNIDSGGGERMTSSRLRETSEALRHDDFADPLHRDVLAGFVSPNTARHHLGLGPVYGGGDYPRGGFPAWILLIIGAVALLAVGLFASGTVSLPFHI